LNGLLGHLDFLGFPGYPNDCEDRREQLPKFHGLKDLPVLCITSFIDVISNLNIVHKDVKMKTFILSLDFLGDEIFYWYKKLGRGEISSLSNFFKDFLEKWFPL